MNNVDVSIIIVSWNTRDILRDCLSSVFEQTTGIEYEVIVVDNASTDGSAEMVRSEFEQVCLIANEENLGFAAANNQGMDVARGRFVLLLNSDTIILEGAIQKTLAFAEQRKGAAVIGCRVLNPDRTFQSTCFMFPSLGNMLISGAALCRLFPEHPFWGRERMTWWKRDDLRPVDVVTGCFMLVRRSAIDAVGRMDDGYFMYGEETDWCYRFQRAGWECVFYPDAEIVHLGGQSSKQVKAWSLVQLRLSILRYFKLYKDTTYYYATSLLMMFFLLVRIPIWALRYVLVSAERRTCMADLKVYWSGVRKICGNLFLSRQDEFRV